MTDRKNLQTVSELRPNLAGYAYSAVLTAIIISVVYVGGRWVAGVTFPWALASLLGVAIAGLLWGSRPAVVVLVACGFFAEVIAPLCSLRFFGNPAAPSILLIRTALYLGCGAVIVTLCHQLLKMRVRSGQQETVVRAFQAMMLPQRIPLVPGFSIACRYRPSVKDEDVGGDFYDIFPIEDGAKYVVTIGDIAGKGKEAATSIALIRYAIRAYALLGFSPGDILARTNSMVLQDIHTNHTATAFVGVIEPASGAIAYATAGHEAPLIVDQRGATRMLRGEGLLLGVIPVEAYATYNDRLDPGECLMMMTDGVTEARNERGDFLGEDGTARLLSESVPCLKARELAERLNLGIDAFTGGGQRDDIAIMLIVRHRAARRRAVKRHRARPRMRSVAEKPGMSRVGEKD